MSCFVYILKQVDGDKLYIGSSETPDQRLKSHNSGKVRSTKTNRPWTRIHLEQLPTKSDALKGEKYLKSGYGRRWVERNVLSRASRSAG